MGRFVNAILFICASIWLVSCKTSSHLEEKKDIHFERSSETLTEGKSEIDFRDFLRASILEKLTGSIVFWSVPDSNGKQHKIADIDLVSLKNSTIEQERSKHQSDSISQKKIEQETLQDNSTKITDNKQDSRPFNLTTIIIVLGIGFLFFVWLRFKK